METVSLRWPTIRLPLLLKAGVGCKPCKYLIIKPRWGTAIRIRVSLASSPRYSNARRGTGIEMPALNKLRSGKHAYDTSGTRTRRP
jgi:hypothetical protein